MSITENIVRVREQIAAACKRAGRQPDRVRLMAVSKTHPAAFILEAAASGIQLFGENRVQDYAEKRPALLDAGMFAEPSPARVHFIGHLQSNKAARAVQLFDAIDSVDSPALAERLNHAAGEQKKMLPICIEIKLCDEPSKHGLAPDTPELEALLERIASLENLHVRGLMTVPPYADDAEQVRPWFRQLRQLRAVLAQQHPHLALEELSMGMSHDFSVAIEEGATTVRVGTAIFGARSKP